MHIAQWLRWHTTSTVKMRAVHIVQNMHFFMLQEKTLKLFKDAEGLPEGWKVASVSCELWRKDYTH